MNQSGRHMGAYVDIAGRFLPHALISTPALTRIEQVARQIPPAPLTIFESRLGETTPDLDFLVCTSPAWITNPTTAQLAAHHEAWKSVYEFCHQWVNASQESWFKRGVDSIWLEFDTSQNPQLPIVPGIFFASLEGCVLQASLEDHVQAVLAALQHMPTKGEWPCETLRRCMAVLPPLGRVYALGDMNGRSASALRVAVSHISLKQLSPYLQKIGWPGDLEETQVVINRLSHLTKTINIDLDIGEEVAPVLGIEFTLPTRFQRNWWGDLFNTLVELGLCLPAKRDALLRWQGYSDETKNTAVWPGVLPHAATQNVCLMVRFVNHVKIVYRPGQQLQAKAYVAMRQVNSCRRNLS